MELANYNLAVDWNADGSFATAGDDVSADFLSATVQRGFASPMARVAAVGRAYFTLNNASKSYSPPLQATRLPRRPVRFQMTYSATTVVLFRGFLERIRPVPGVARDRRVVLECVDALALLDVHEGPTALLIGVGADTVISTVVSAVYTPPATNYQAGINIFPFSADRWSGVTDFAGTRFGMLFEEITASQKILDACVSDWGRFFVSKAGSPTFFNRHQMTLDTTTELTLADDMLGMGYEKDVSEVYNAIMITCHPRTVGTVNEVLGRLSQGSAPVIEASASVVFVVYFRDPSNAEIQVGGLSVITPVATTDYSCTSDPEGQGTNQTASVTAAIVTYADRAEVTLTNGVAAPVYVQFLQVRGLAVRVRETVTATSSDVTSQTIYQKRKLRLDAPLMNLEQEAQRLGDHLKDIYDVPLDRISGIQIVGNQSATFMAAVRNLELMDRVVITESQTGLAAYAGFISSMTHTIPAQGDHILTFDIETAFTVSNPFRISDNAAVGGSALNSGDVLIY